MNDILLALIGIAVLANFAYTLWSYYSLRRVTASLASPPSDVKLLIETIVHTRSSLNLLYASIAIMVFVLGFFGFNIQKNVTAEVKREIADAARVDLDSLRFKAQTISLIESLARQHGDYIQRTKEESRLLIEALRRTPQKLYVIQALSVTNERHRFSFSELQSVDGVKLSQFAKPPVILMRAYEGGSDVMGVGLTTTTQGIDFSPGGACLVDLWIYAK